MHVLYKYLSVCVCLYVSVFSKSDRSVSMFLVLSVSQNANI